MFRHGTQKYLPLGKSVELNSCVDPTPRWIEKYIAKGHLCTRIPGYTDSNSVFGQYGAVPECRDIGGSNARNRLLL